MSDFLDRASTPEEFVDWIISLDNDDPDHPGRIDRKTVTLTAIVELAKKVATPTPVEERGERWVSCTRYESATAARYRHRIAKVRGTETTLCGATGLPSSVWRSNKTKPPCPTCERRATPGYVAGSDY